MHHFLRLVLILFPLQLLAERRELTEMRTEAARFLLEKTGQKVTNKALSAHEKQLELTAGTPAAWLFTTADRRFVLTAADDKLPPVLGYGTFSGGTVPAAFKSLMHTYTHLLASSCRTLHSPLPYNGPAISPLLTATRHQKPPYNAYCPHYTYDDGTTSEERCVVGCVATAMEEVISYYRRTVTLQDTLHGWETAHYVIPDVLPGASVDTRLIRDSYNTPGTYTDAEADAVARLSYYLGIAARMNWGLGESGARVRYLTEPLKRAFGFGFVHYADSYCYKPADWLQILRNEIQSGRPVFYAGSAMRLNGHAFVLDGIDSAGRFHVNWGVDGDYDGFFDLDVLNAAEPWYDMTETGLTEGFFCNQRALLFHPDAITPALPDTLKRTGREVAIDSIRPELPPEKGKITPLRLYLRNTAEYPTTTPLELFTNTSADTALFEQADFVGLTGVSLQPGERKEIVVQALFSKDGERILRVSPDDEAIIHETPISVVRGKAPNVVLSPPALSFPQPGTVQIKLAINNYGEGRSGNKVTYELFEGKPHPDHNGTAHADYCLLMPGESETDSIRFCGLKGGEEYTLYVRFPWTVQYEVAFTMPPSTGIRPPSNPEPGQKVPASSWYGLDGRRITRPSGSGIYIHGGEKVIVR